MKSLGLQAYRLSISWPRVLPDGTGAVNAKGLDFYDRLIDELLRRRHHAVGDAVPLGPAAGALPPRRLAEPRHRRLVRRLRDADRQALGDRVKHWMPLNEPQVFLGAGLIQGRHAPGDKLRFAEFLLAAHNTLLAHGRAVQALRATAKLPARIGTAQAGYNYVPATDSADDLAARGPLLRDRRRQLQAERLLAGPDDPRAATPKTASSCTATSMPAIRAGDMETIKQPLDFLGMTLVQRRDPVRRGKDGKPEVIPWPPGYPITGFDWAVAPSILRLIPTWLHERYKLPIVIAENGLSVRDWVAADGGVHDPDRIDFTGALPARARRGDRGRRSRRGLLPLVDPRQLRVGRGLQAPLRPGLRELRDAEAHGQGFGQVVPRRDRVERATPARGRGA